MLLYQDMVSNTRTLLLLHLLPRALFYHNQLYNMLCYVQPAEETDELLLADDEMFDVDPESLRSG